MIETEQADLDAFATNEELRERIDGLFLTPVDGDTSIAEKILNRVFRSSLLGWSSRPELSECRFGVIGVNNPFLGGGYLAVEMPNPDLREIEKHALTKRYVTYGLLNEKSNLEIDNPAVVLSEREIAALEGIVAILEMERAIKVA